MSALLRRNGSDNLCYLFPDVPLMSHIEVLFLRVLSVMCYCIVCCSNKYSTNLQQPLWSPEKVPASHECLQRLVLRSPAYTAAFAAQEHLGGVSCWLFSTGLLCGIRAKNAIISVVIFWELTAHNAKHSSTDKFKITSKLPSGSSLWMCWCFTVLDIGINKLDPVFIFKINSLNVDHAGHEIFFHSMKLSNLETYSF